MRSEDCAPLGLNRVRSQLRRIAAECPGFRHPLCWVHRGGATEARSPATGAGLEGVVASNQRRLWSAPGPPIDSRSRMRSQRNFEQFYSSPADSKSQRDEICGNLVIRGVVIPQLGIELQPTVTYLISDAATDIRSKRVGARAPGDDLNLSNGAAIPP